MIHCQACRRLTVELDGMCSRCIEACGPIRPEEDVRRFALSYLRKKDNELEMAFIQWQIDHREDQK